MDMHSLARPPAAVSQRRIRWSFVTLGLLVACATAAQAAGEPGAAALFYGDRNAVPGGGKGFRPAIEPGALATAANASKASAPAAALPSRPGLRVWLTDANDASRRLSPQQTFRTGDRMRLTVQPNRDGHLYVVNVGTSGQTRVLFPRPGQDNRVRQFQDFAFASPLVFSEPAGTDQLVVVLAAAALEDVPVQLSDGRRQRLSLRGDGAFGGGAAQGPAPRTGTAGGSTSGRDAAADSLALALADLQGSKDLKFDDDGAELVAVSGRVDERRGSTYSPVVINLRLTHRR